MFGALLLCEVLSISLLLLLSIICTSKISTGWELRNWLPIPTLVMAMVMLLVISSASVFVEFFLMILLLVLLIDMPFPRFVLANPVLAIPSKKSPLQTRQMMAGTVTLNMSFASSVEWSAKVMQTGNNTVLMTVMVTATILVPMDFACFAPEMVLRIMATMV